MSSGASSKRRYNDPEVGPNKRQRQEGDICPTEEPHMCAASVVGKRKYYAIWGGPNPGVHHTTWDVARNWSERFNVKQRAFKDASQASNFYQEQKRMNPGLADRFRRACAASQVSPGQTNGQQLSHPPKPHTPPPPPHGQDQQSHTTKPTEPHLEVKTEPLDQCPAPLELPGPRFNGNPVPSPYVPGPQATSIVSSREPTLSTEQAVLVDLIVKARKNVFYTGSAGVGKSRVLKAFRQRLSVMGLKVNVVAPTGRAALDINGSTTWSYAGWTPDSMKKPLEELRHLAWKKKAKKRLQKTDVLVIDEISMVENLHLERLSSIMKEVRQNGKAFGGVQVVVTGDFCQLPPVKPFTFCIDCGKPLIEKAKRSAYECTKCNRIYNEEDKWAFRSNAWKEANFEHVSLETIFRQRDHKFVDILQKLRLGKPLLEDDRRLLCQNKPNIDKAIKLFPRKQDVKRINDTEFRKLQTESRLYHCVDNFKQQNHHSELQCYNQRAVDGTLTKLVEHRYEPHLELKEGMLVVLLANISISEGLVNGSQGTIVGFKDFWYEDEEQKSDEQKISDIEFMLEGDYQEYRARQIFDFMTAAPRKQWPIVRFFHEGQFRELPITASCYPTELGDEPATNPRYSLLSRTQIPLMAAWAMTIHKSQGMTLEKVEVDLSRNFEEGMAYVALSRVRTLEGLRVVSFPENAEMECNEEVRDFLREMFNIE